MLSLETNIGRIALFASILLMVLGGLLFTVSVLGIAGLLIQERFTWDRANPALITAVVSAIVVVGGVLLYRRIERDPERLRAQRKQLA